VLAADNSVKPSAEQDNVVSANSSRHTDVAPGDVEDALKNFNDEWQQDVDELVTWTNSLKV